MDELTEELRRRVAEDGGVLFQCRPRGWPPGRFGRFVAVALVCWPHAMTWSLWGWDMLAAALGVPDAGRRSQQPLLSGLPGLSWGLESPLFDGVVVPWLVLGGTGLLLGELVCLALYRSRRIVVTPRSVHVTQGIFVESIHTRRRIGQPEVLVGPDGVETWADGWLSLGRLDPLDVQDLVRTLGAPDAQVTAPFWRWPALLFALVALLACGPALGCVSPLFLVLAWLGWRVRRLL